MSSAARTPLPWQLRLARGAVGYAALVSGLLLLSLPWPTSANPGEHATAIVLVTVVVAGLFSVVTLTWRRRTAWAAMVGLGLLSMHVIVLRAAQALLGTTLRPGANPEGISWLLGGSVLIELEGGMLCCLAVRDWRVRLG